MAVGENIHGKSAEVKSMSFRSRRMQNRQRALKLSNMTHSHTSTPAGPLTPFPPSGCMSVEKETSSCHHRYQQVDLQACSAVWVTWVSNRLVGEWTTLSGMQQNSYDDLELQQAAPEWQVLRPVKYHCAPILNIEILASRKWEWRSQNLGNERMLGKSKVYWHTK